MALIPIRRRKEGRREETPALNMFSRDLSRLFEDFVEGFGIEPFVQAGVNVSLDVSETDNEVVVTAEVPGIKKEDIDISIANGVLTLKGEKKEEKEEKSKNYHRIERTFGSFHRSISLPSYVDIDKAKAVSKDGLLTVTFPKKEEAKPKEIKVDVE